jgi:CubicO group peptidase (beta-lactamase class C family)
MNPLPRLMLAGVSLAIAGDVHAQLRYDFTEVTRLAAGAVIGQNVGAPVPGFELLLMKDGQVVYHEAFGTMSPGQVVACDSATKTISGAVVMSLTERSATPFSLNTRVSFYMPAYGGDKSAITIRQCFAHTSGLAESNVEGNASITLQQAAFLTSQLPLQFPPGTAFAYGGSSMQTAGAVAELASGMSWNALFAERLATPLGFAQTRFALTTPTNPRVPGGCVSNAIEFSRFMEMLRAGGVHEGRRVLAAASVASMFTRQTQAGIPIINSPVTGTSDYGVGVWLDQRDANGQLVGALAAGARGFSSWIDFDDGMVGCFATEFTTAENAYPLCMQIRDAAQRAVRQGPVCVADFNRDGGVDGSDVSAFFFAWERGGDAADVNEDGGTDGADIEAFFRVWEAGGC